MEHFFEIILHAVKDTLPLLPWILLFYIVIQLLESRIDLNKANNLNGKLGPLVGAATGLVPQCGFSVMAAKLFERKYITLGTLFAIFFATSDEAFIIMLSSGEGAVWVLPMLASKMLIGIAVGYAVDLSLKFVGYRQVCVQLPENSSSVPQTTHEIFMQRYMDEKEVEANCSCGSTHGDTSSPWKRYLFYPLIHTLKVVGFIFLVNFVLTAIIHSVGEESFAGFMHKNRFLQPFLSSLIGLIPNCASSVVLTESFLEGAITFGSCLAGLCANAGLGFVVLMKNVRRWKRNLIMIAFCYFLSVVIGLLFNLFPIVL